VSRGSAVAFAAGLVFALGLGVSGMTDPRNVLAFLDVTGGWDPSLALVMGGAIGVHAMVARRARRGPASPDGERYSLWSAPRVDRRLLLGAAVFGLGWGVAGFCPGPALVSLVSLSPSTIAFVGAMVAGMLLFDRLYDAPRGRADE
jgi:uncharacterized protein